MPKAAFWRPAIDLEKYWENLHNQGFTGAGISIGVIDTGASASTYDFGQRLNAQARNSVGQDVCWGKVEKFWSDDVIASPQQLKHGDAVFRRLLAGAPSSSFLDIQTLFPQTSVEKLLAAIGAAIDRRVDVLNLSLGRMVQNDSITGHWTTCPVCKLANQLAFDYDVLPVAAWGNWANQAMACPAIAENVISVGSILSKEETAAYAQHPDQQMRDFLEGRSSTSFSAAMASAKFAVFRSAFPGVDARGWIDFSQNNSRAAKGGYNWGTDHNLLMQELQAICGWSANFADWKEFAAAGIVSRRELVNAAFTTGVIGYPKLGEWLTIQRTHLDIFSAAQLSFARATDSLEKIAISDQITELRNAVAGYLTIGQKTRAAIVRIFLGSKLVQRSKNLIPGHIVGDDAIAAESELTESIQELIDSPPRDQKIYLGNALAWRARARTLLASADSARNEEALVDARLAVDSILTSGMHEGHDLAIAYLHLARAHYFAAWLRRQQQVPNVNHASAVLTNAARALEVSPSDGSDGYVRSDATWLLQHADGSD